MLKLHEHRLKRRAWHKFVQYPVDFFQVNSARQNIIGNTDKISSFFPFIPPDFYSSVIKIFIIYSIWENK